MLQSIFETFVSLSFYLEVKSLREKWTIIKLYLFINIPYTLYTFSPFSTNEIAFSRIVCHWKLRELNQSFEIVLIRSTASSVGNLMRREVRQARHLWERLYLG